jgi:hypothetical protein
VIFNIARASAEMAVERLGNGFFQLSACYRLLGEALQQNLTLVQEPGRAIAALERCSDLRRAAKLYLVLRQT